MSSTQARILLNAEQLANCEYEGQQINQARSVLASRSAAQQEKLLSLQVPTPPVTTDYQTIKYSGTLGATKYAFDASSVKPNGTDDTYTITMQQQAYGSSLQKNITVALVETGDVGGFRGVEIDKSASSQTTVTSDVATGFYEEDPNGNVYIVPVTDADIQNATKTNDDGTTTVKEGTYYIQTDGGFVKTTCAPGPGCYKLGTGEGAIRLKEKTVQSSEVVTDNNGLGFIQSSQLSSIYIDEGGSVRPATLADFTYDANQPNILKFKSDLTYVQASDTGKMYQQKGDVAGVTVGNKGVHPLTEDEKQKYGEAIANCGLKNSDGEAYTVDDFYIFYDDKGGASFVLINDVWDGNNNATTYSYVANGEYTKNQTYDDAKIIFDPTNGRITEVAIPNYDEDGNIISWSSISVQAETVIDDAAYADATAKYEYDNLIYDQEMQKINHEIDKIQQEDKNLELKLQKLDTKRQQLTTEKEALEKVLQDAVEDSYKTFSG